MSALRIPLCLLLLLTLSFSFLSCLGEPASPFDVLRAVCDAETPLPAGRIYVLSAPEDDAMHPSDSLIATTFGNGTMPPEMDHVADAAFFFSYAHPCELAIFRCKSADGTDQVAELCLRRLDYLKHHRTDLNSTSLAYLENARVTVRGNWVILAISSDPDAALRAFRRSL